MREEPSLRPTGFGIRYLTDQEKVWEHNAWDNVQWEPEMEEEAERVIKGQREAKVGEDAATELLSEPNKQWDAFYSQHSNKFFMDRNWLLKEFPELDMEKYPEGSNIRVLEVGCGVGNTSFPLLEWDEKRRMFLYSCDYSSVAVDVLKNNPKYDETHGKAFVWDITQPTPDGQIEEGSLDVVICIYVLSALHPTKTKQAVEHLVRLLKPGGSLLIKDYGRYDLTQLRFKKNRLIEENLYCRGDGTLVYFRSQEELDELLSNCHLSKEASVVDRRLIVNRAKQNKKLLLRLTCQTLKFRTLVEGVLEDEELYNELMYESAYQGDEYLIYVLIYEFLAGNGLNSAGFRLKQPIFQRAKWIQDREKALADEGRGVEAVKEEGKKLEEGKIKIPRYARINTLKWTAEEALKTLEEEEWKITRLDPSHNFAYRVSNIKKNEILVDPHVENLLIFPTVDDFQNYWMVQERYIILQDKASCLPAFVLAPPEGAQCMDTCAAPGNKTSHLAAIVGPKGKIWATDRAADRIETMKHLLEVTGVTNASVFCGDMLKTDMEDKKFSKVEYAVVDPPCSGSGMVKRMDELTGRNNGGDRLIKLGNLQATILQHAFKLPRLKRLVYSTCSINKEENEEVVEEVLFKLDGAWRLQRNLLPSWTYRGLSEYKCGKYCLRADPKETLTDGFFVAVFERVVEGMEDEEESVENGESTEKKGKNKKEKKGKKPVEEEEEVQEEEEQEEEAYVEKAAEPERVMNPWEKAEMAKIQKGRKTFDSDDEEESVQKVESPKKAEIVKKVESPKKAEMVKKVETAKKQTEKNTWKVESAEKPRVEYTRKPDLVQKTGGRRTFNDSDDEGESEVKTETQRKRKGVENGGEKTETKKNKTEAPKNSKSVERAEKLKEMKLAKEIAEKRKEKSKKKVESAEKKTEKSKKKVESDEKKIAKVEGGKIKKEKSKKKVESAEKQTPKKIKLSKAKRKAAQKKKAEEKKTGKV